MKKALIALSLLCLAASLPPPPPRLKPVLQSPKGAEQTASLAKVAAPAQPLVYVVPSKVLAWDWNSDTNNPASNVVFLVLSTADLSLNRTNWTLAATVTNKQYQFTLTRPMEFFNVRASNVVTHLVSI